MRELSGITVVFPFESQEFLTMGVVLEREYCLSVDQDSHMKDTQLSILRIVFIGSTRKACMQSLIFDI